MMRWLQKGCVIKYKEITMSNKKQSSVRWTIEELEKFELGKSRFFSKAAIINHADRLHKQEIINAYYGKSHSTTISNGEQFYNEEYGGEK